MKNQEISSLIGQGRAYNSSSFLLRVSKNEDKKPRNIAILASKKNFNTAVVRNKVRRLIKNAVRRVVLDSKASTLPYNLIFSPKKGFENIVFADLVAEIKQIFIKSAII